MILFETQTRKDFEADWQHMELVDVGAVLVRKGITRASWSLGTVLDDVKDEPCDDKVLLVHHICDPRVRVAPVYAVQKVFDTWRRHDMIIGHNIQITVASQLTMRLRANSEPFFFVETFVRKCPSALLAEVMS